MLRNKYIAQTLFKLVYSHTFLEIVNKNQSKICFEPAFTCTFTSDNGGCQRPIATALAAPSPIQVKSSFRDLFSGLIGGIQNKEYSSIGHRLEVGLSLAFLLLVPDFKPKTSLDSSSKTTGETVFWFYRKTVKWARLASFCFWSFCVCFPESFGSQYPRLSLTYGLRKSSLCLCMNIQKFLKK